MPIDKDIKNEINRADNLGDVFRSLQSHYDLDKTKLGMFAKSILLAKIDGIVDWLNPPKKNGSIRSH